MKTFKVVATLHTTSVMKTEVAAENLSQATILALQRARNDDWKTTRELKTDAK